MKRKSSVENELSQENAKFNHCTVLESETTDLARTDDFEHSNAWRRIFNFDSENQEDKKLALKIDFFILTYICLGYFVKNLDQMNVRNAYVSGLEKDLSFQGRQYNYLQTWWLVGYILGAIPSQILLCVVRASILLPSLEFLWSIVTIFTCFVPNVHTFYGIRFLVGFLEAAAYPSFIVLLGNWYTTSLGFKITLIQISSSGAQMFLGYLQAALFETMNDRGGLASWRWLFIFDGIIGIPVCIFGFLCILDTPNNTRAWWLSNAERKKCVLRMEKCGRAMYSKLHWGLVKQIFLSWPVYLFTANVVFHELSINLSTFMNLWLKSLPDYKNDVSMLNIIPTISYAIQIVVMIIFSLLSDLVGRRVPFICGYAALGAIGSLILLICEKIGDGTHYEKAKFAGWFIMSAEMGYVTMLLTYLSELLSLSAEQRTITIGVTQAIGFTFQAWVPLLIYPADEAPHYTKGYQCAFSFFCIQIILTCLTKYICTLEKKGSIKFLSQRKMTSSDTSNSDTCGST